MDTNQLQLENEKLNARLDKAKEVFRQQAIDIKAKDEAYLKLKDEYDELNKQFSELETQKQSISDMYNKTVDGLKMRDNEIEELKKTISKFEEGNSNHDALQEELNTTKKALHIANESISEYASKCTRYDEVIKSLNEKNDDLDVLATSRLVDIKKRDEDIENLNKNIEEINGTYNKLNDEFSNLVIKYNDIFADKEKLASDYNALILKYEELQNTYNTLVEECKSKTEALNKALDEVQVLTKRLNTESGKIEEVKSKTEVAVTSIKKKLQALNDGLGDEFNIFG